MAEVASELKEEEKERMRKKLRDPAIELLKKNDKPINEAVADVQAMLEKVDGYATRVITTEGENETTFVRIIAVKDGTTEFIVWEAVSTPEGIEFK